MPRSARRGSSGAADIWPGFVDGLSTLLLVVMFVLSIFVVAQFYLGEQLSQTSDELTSAQARLDALAEELGLARSANERLQSQVLALEDTIEAREDEVARLQTDLAAAGRGLAATEAELEDERALTEEQEDEIAVLNRQLAGLRAQLASLQEALEAAEAKDAEQQAQIENLSSRLNTALARKVQELADVRSRFFEQLREALGQRDDVRVVGDRFVFESDVLFGSCSATISQAGRDELAKLGQTLLDIRGEIPDEVAWVLRVDGHADQQALGAGCRARFESNWHLSSARAISVVQYLASEGVPENRLVAAGFGEYQPLVEGRDRASLAQNRRIEFKLTER